MKRSLLSLFFIFLTLALFAQNYAIGHRTMVWKDASRNNRKVKTEIYYPASAKGENTPLANDGKSYPVLVFGHGYQLTYANYLWLKDSLVPQGYYVAFARTEERLLPNHTQLAKDLAFIVTSFNTDKNNTASFLYNRVLAKYAVGGHSMGGGCSLLSVQYSSLITTEVPFAAAETDPSAISSCENIRIPSLLFGGEKDCISPPADNQIPMYNNTPAACKAYAEVKGAKHCHWAMNAGKCTLGEATSCGFATDYKPTLKTTMSLLLPWLNGYLYGQSDQLTVFNNTLHSSTSVTYLQSCSALNTTPLTAQQVVKPLRIYPVPVHAGEMVNIELPFVPSKPMAASITDGGSMKTAVIKLQSIGNSFVRLSTAGWQKGVHYIYIENESVRYKGTVLIE